jgi:hypothetical protein
MFSLFLYLFLIFVILFFAYYNTYTGSEKQQESIENFTTHIRRFYRPYVRRARVYTEHFYNHAQGHVNRVLKKTGFY